MPIELSTLPVIVQSIIGGATYGLLGYARVRFDPDNPESFDPVKIGSTVLFAALIGVGFELAGVQPTYEHYLWALMTFVGTIAAFEKALQAIVKGNREGAAEHLTEAGENAVSTVLSLGGTRESTTKSIEEGAAEYRDKSDDELREEWDGRLPEREAYLQVDDYEGEETREYEAIGVPSDVRDEDADETESGLSPP